MFIPGPHILTTDYFLEVEKNWKTLPSGTCILLMKYLTTCFMQKDRDDHFSLLNNPEMFRLVKSCFENFKTMSIINAYSAKETLCVLFSFLAFEDSAMVTMGDLVINKIIE